MTSTITRSITITLAALALTAPVAGAMPIRDDEGVRTSSLAGTPAPKQDLRNPDQQAPAPKPKQDLRNPDQQAPAPPASSPEPVVRTEPVAVDDGPSPFVFIAPTLVLVAMLGVAFLYTRSARRPARV